MDVGPQPMVDDPRVCAAGKSDRVMGVCVHPMAQPRLGRWPAGVTVPAPSQPWSGDAPATCFRPTAPAPHHQPLQARRRAGAGGPLALTVLQLLRKAFALFHRFDPTRSPGTCFKWIAEILRFPHNLAVLEFHDADRKGRLPVVQDYIFGNP